jgi:hypothetical protein
VATGRSCGAGGVAGAGERSPLLLPSLARRGPPAAMARAALPKLGSGRAGDAAGGSAAALRGRDSAAADAAASAAAEARACSESGAPSTLARRREPTAR